ncbi:MAG: hypothetical protein EBT30_10050 [Verrucomicrobia bacterium]|nr:hypothetical protein [Verrucomicrobiota bacterium]
MNVPLHGLFLAGGKSSRMGREKASLVVGNVGLTQAARGIGLLRKLCDHTYLSLREGQAAPEGAGQIPVIRDSEEAQGPLAGILGAFRETPAATWLVMACDLPFVSEILVANLVASFRETPNAPFAAYASSRDGLPEPLCAIYGPASRSILHLENLNTPEDLAEAVAAREIHLAWFGSLAERRGLRQETVLVKAGTAEDLLREIEGRHRLGLDPKAVRVAINDEFVPRDCRVQAGDKVAFLLPSAGG